ncbi:MAG: exosortase K [Acidobacteriota bacterium]
MRPRQNVNLIAQVAAVLTSAAALKFFYSGTSVNGLRWVLAPTAFLVQTVGDQSFTFEPYAGYMSADHSFIIAASCSGVNFLIAAFLMLTITKLARNWRGQTSWMFLPICAAAAYLTTIVANAVRILGAMELQHRDTETIWLNPAECHRFEGIIVYFGFLLLLFVLADLARGEDPLSSRHWGRLAIPLLAYYAITLGVPLANGAFRPDAAFVEHALFVLVTPLMMAAPVGLLIFIRGRFSV